MTTDRRGEVALADEGTTPAASVFFAVLGHLELAVDARRVRVPGGRQRVLLATLLVHANEVVPVGFLCRALWGERQPMDPHNALATCMARLRRRLAAIAGPLARRIETTSAGYEMAVGADELDLLRFRHAVREAGRAADRGDLAAARRLLDEALSLWRGPMLAEIDSESLHNGVLVGVAEERMLALERRHTLDLLLGRGQEIIGELRVLAGEHPARERFWHHLMLALHRAGRSAEALESFQTADAYLREEFGAEAGEDLRTLHLAILRRDPSLLTAAPAARWLPGSAWALARREPVASHWPASLAGLS